MPHEFIQILAIGMGYETTVGAVTTPGVYNLDKITAADGSTRAIVNANAVLTFDSAKLLNQATHVDLNLNTAESPIAGEPSYPTAVRGDVLVLELVTQGVGAGAQDVRPYVIYRERTQA